MPHNSFHVFCGSSEPCNWCSPKPWSSPALVSAVYLLQNGQCKQKGCVCSDNTRVSWLPCTGSACCDKPFVGLCTKYLVWFDNCKWLKAGLPLRSSAVQCPLLHVQGKTHLRGAVIVTQQFHEGKKQEGEDWCIDVFFKQCRKLQAEVGMTKVD